MKHTHSDRIEKYLGSEMTANISAMARDWYGPPIQVLGVPGNVCVARGGDFVGAINGGDVSLVERLYEHTARAVRRASRQRGQLNAGFASLSDLITELTTGAKRREFSFWKTGATGVAGATNTLWNAGGQPIAGANGAAAPGGTVHVDSDTGAFNFANPTSGDQQHLLSAFALASIGTNALLMYDRLFSVAKTASSTATQAVTGVPTRYQSTTSGAADSAEGNFLFVECTGALGATAHNWTVCTYTDQSGNAGATLPSLTGNSSNIASRLDHPLGQWFAPLASGDLGIQALTQMQCSASVTGTINFVIGHPLGVMPLNVANTGYLFDFLNTAFGLPRIFDDACIAFLELAKGATTATKYTGQFITAAG
jgi:hypothetical protein